MKERLLTGLAIIFIVIVVFLTKIIMQSTIIFDIFIGLIAILSALEMANILNKTNLYSHKYLIAVFPILLYVLTMICITSKLSAIVSVFLFVALLIFAILVSFLISIFMVSKTENEMRIRKIRISRKKFAFNKALHTSFGLLYPSISIMLLVVFNHIGELTHIFSGTVSFGFLIGIVMLGCAFLIPFICDTFAYLTGNVIGGKKLCPKISEHKTVAGAVGGIVWTALILTVIFLLFSSGGALPSMFISIGLEWYHITILAVVGAIACEFGDLFESILKRKANIKDSSDFLPGHGGILDRIDGFTFSTIVVFVFFLFFLI
ncbi:MAG: phosphatidate cytidylyltransferase [Clostridia bacterium]|nr:phosphatidate cytidylyltransferase [Clostridia bacterium]